MYWSRVQFWISMRSHQENRIRVYIFGGLGPAVSVHTWTWLSCWHRVKRNTPSGKAKVKKKTVRREYFNNNAADIKQDNAERSNYEEGRKRLSTDAATARYAWSKYMFCIHTGIKRLILKLNTTGHTQKFGWTLWSTCPQCKVIWGNQKNK